MRLIDAEELMEWAYNWVGKIPADALWGKVRRMIVHDAVPVRHGKWIETIEFHGIYDECPRRAYACSECHVAFPTDDYLVKDFRYCPNCGAKMEVEHETD